MSTVAEQMTPVTGPPVCGCGHVEDDHEPGHGTQPCEVCDCGEYVEDPDQ